MLPIAQALLQQRVGQPLQLAGSAGRSQPVAIFGILL
jgi:hypothetical protein